MKLVARALIVVIPVATMTLVALLVRFPLDVWLRSVLEALTLYGLYCTAVFAWGLLSSRS